MRTPDTRVRRLSELGARLIDAEELELAAACWRGISRRAIHRRARLGARGCARLQRRRRHGRARLDARRRACLQRRRRHSNRRTARARNALRVILALVGTVVPRHASRGARPVRAAALLVSCDLGVDCCCQQHSGSAGGSDEAPHVVGLERTLEGLTRDTLIGIRADLRFLCTCCHQHPVLFFGDMVAELCASAARRRAVLLPWI